MNQFVVATLLLWTVAAPLVADDLPPGVVDTQQASDIPLSPAESQTRITVPEGFHVTLFAGEPDIRRPIAFDFDDRGRLWVVENYSHPEWRQDGATDRIVILEDTNQDGRFDQRKVFWDSGRYLTGIALGHGGVWIANSPELAFLPDRNRDDLPDSPPIALLDGFQVSSNNVLNNLHWGPDGWLYGAIGISTPSLVGQPGASKLGRKKISRGIWRYHPIHGNFEVVAEGMVNPWGADFNEYGDLFTSNTVIAHLWHIVPGMYCQRRGVEQDYPYAYGRIQSIADHLHWGGGNWKSSRDAEPRHSVAGGGHAHCGGMVYLGDNWPESYRGTFFTANLHGNRVNRDRLVPNRSTYVGVHADDFLFGHDPWFRGLSIKYGPDGGVYLSDWHDLGECHDSDGSHRSSGRIFKIVYGEPKLFDLDLQLLSSLKLANLHLHRNAWWVRHARRILQERAAASEDVFDATQKLRSLFQNETDERHQLRALWTLFVMQQLSQDELVEMLQHKSLHVRRWAVRFLVDNSHSADGNLNESLNENSLSLSALAKMKELAHVDPAAKVRLALASALQRMTHEQRKPIACALMEHAEDSNDPYLPLMIWYGMEPLVATNQSAALEWASRSKIPLLRRNIVRRLLEVDSPPVDLIVHHVLQCTDDNLRFDFLNGMLDALEKRGSHSTPKQWPKLYPQMTATSHRKLRSLATRLAILFGDKQAITNLRRVVLDPQASSNQRQNSLLSLLKIDDGLSLTTLHDLLQPPSELRPQVIQALILRNDHSTADRLLAVYPTLDPTERQAAIHVLSSRRDFARRLLTEIEQENIQQHEVSAYALAQLRAFRNEELQHRIGQIWTNDSQTLVKSDNIARYQQRMTAEYLAQGDDDAGRLLFKQSCANCHSLFGQGGHLGPDLTGSGRKDLNYIISNLIDPNAIVDPAYHTTTILTMEGRLYSGIMIEYTEDRVSLQTQNAQIRLPLDSIEELRTSHTSMMPEGLLRKFSDKQVRDLLLYLRSSGDNYGSSDK
ncbi:MAG: PVC-type heme-binding CxxCH protein [Pirellulales bacterium]